MFSKSAALGELLLFNDGHAAQPAHVIPLDSRWHRTYHSWHVFVSGLKAGQLYGY
jgi:glycogen operon protein